MPTLPGNEGYTGLGRSSRPAKPSHHPHHPRGQPWFPCQYFPHVYYNEHCIGCSTVPTFTPMKIDRAAFQQATRTLSLFHYFMVGSNADLPIVGGSILSHDHFQGGAVHFATWNGPWWSIPSPFAGYPEVEVRGHRQTAYMSVIWVCAVPTMGTVL